MGKRKRDEVPDEPQTSGLGDRKLRIQRLQLEQKLQHSATQLHRGLKLARGFERQKLGRRQKAAGQKNDRIQLRRLEDEVEALKVEKLNTDFFFQLRDANESILQALDLGVTAERHLLKLLTKVKAFTEAPAFVHLNPASRISQPEGTRTDSEINVTARLFKSNPVREVIPGIMDGVRRILGLSAQENSSATATKVPKLKEQAESASGMDREKKPKRADTDKIDQTGSLAGGSDDDFDSSRYNDRIASSGSESESEVEDDARKEKAAYDPIADLSLSDASSVASSDSNVVKQSKSTSTRKPNPKSSSSTTFLPTLMGGYWSGSESEPEADVGAAPVRKNRMGQQARRQLWEKKYGGSANHLQKQANEKKNNRDSGWDMRKGATSQNDTRGAYGRNKIKKQQAGPVERNGRSWSAVKAPETPGSRPTARKEVQDKPLHPSWEAARKKKEMKTLASFQGTKVVFD
ncbi:hypothetical protein FQN57_000602 [Myotisia sp. PD_48]|nr:hypothetical protein FQN57_000602 [Myotisia sp. PD_48]